MKSGGKVSDELSPRAKNADDGGLCCLAQIPYKRPAPACRPSPATILSQNHASANADARLLIRHSQGFLIERALVTTNRIITAEPNRPRPANTTFPIRYIEKTPSVSGSCCLAFYA
ncbi:hypothetical protein L249_0913 [Ophiocordyceps polyrhachis-furcata BCC 54312]|uniref:Uncharacterized protein n=1 Tax=Ophiocordyceps polyrhachis-furcata BCC 54312 TaxID=1330021 RepID=A0A367LEQ0_9HYPO|nr:hypothetical protein L249_0913 [Ophiocordyceps polyrhachis-furcata BCC 54312]